MKFRVRYAEQVVGVFTLVALAFVALVLILMGINQRWFAKDYSFTSRFPTGDGLSVGMPIKFKGFQIGQVDQIELEQDNSVGIRFHIYDTYINKINRDSVLELTSSPLGLGGGLVFHPGKLSGPHVAENSYIPSINMPDGQALVQRGLVDIPPNNDTVTRLVGEVEPILRNVSTTLVSINRLVSTMNDNFSGEGKGPVGTLVNRASSLADQATVTLDDVTQKVDAVLANLQVVSARLSDATSSPEGVVQGLLKPEGSVKTLLNDNNALYNRINGTIDNLNHTIDQIDSFIKYLNSSQPQITGVLEQGRQTLVEGRDVLEGLRNNPLIKGGIPAKIEQPGTHRGYRDTDF